MVVMTAASTHCNSLWASLPLPASQYVLVKTDSKFNPHHVEVNPRDYYKNHQLTHKDETSEAWKLWRVVCHLWSQSVNDFCAHWSCPWINYKLFMVKSNHLSSVKITNGCQHFFLDYHHFLGYFTTTQYSWICESYLPVLELEFRNCFWVQKTEFRRRPLAIALPAVAYLNIHILKWVART